MCYFHVGCYYSAPMVLLKRLHKMYTTTKLLLGKLTEYCGSKYNTGLWTNKRTYSSSDCMVVVVEHQFACLMMS